MLLKHCPPNSLPGGHQRKHGAKGVKNNGNEKEETIIKSEVERRKREQVHSLLLSTGGDPRGNSQSHQQHKEEISEKQ